jgi:hypothetical protein
MTFSSSNSQIILEAPVKPYRLFLTSVFVTLLFSSAVWNSTGVANAATQHGFRVKEYEKFHDVLHPLEHDALPKKNYRRIRSQANLLVRRGNAIVKLGVPVGTSDDKKEEFAKELNSFREALARFRTDARRGTNSQLKASYSAVHDTFEMLAALTR